MKDRQTEELRAFSLFTRTCTLPLIEESETETTILGTGTLFTVNGKYYLITAAHVIEDLVAAKQLDRIGIPLGMVSAVSNLGRHYISYVQWKDKNTNPFDVAIIRFDQPELVAALRRTWNFISPKNLGPLPERKQGLLVAGYPRQVSSQIGFELSAKFMTFATNELPSPPEDRDCRPGLDIFMRLDKAGTGLDGKDAEIPKLHGVSGGSVWVAHHDTEAETVWDPESHLKLVGIQTAYVRGSYIRAKSWQLVAVLFEGLDPEAATEIRAALYV